MSASLWEALNDLTIQQQLCFGFALLIAFAFEFINGFHDTANAVTTVIQILGGKPVAVWPREAAVQKFVFPRPKA